MTYREPDRDPHEADREAALEEALRELEKPSTFERPEPEPERSTLDWVRLARFAIAIGFSMTTLASFFEACGR